MRTATQSAALSKFITSTKESTAPPKPENHMSSRNQEIMDIIKEVEEMRKDYDAERESLAL